MILAFRLLPLFAALVTGLAISSPAQAFTFSDGSVERCVLRDGSSVPERRSRAPQGYTGLTSPDGNGGFVITWDMDMLNSLPSYAHDYIFYHECAHALVPTLNELTANCVGLKLMREAGRSSRAIERQLAAFHASKGFMGPQYGYGAEYWAGTLRCANAGDDDDQTNDTSSSSYSTRCRFVAGPRAGQVLDYAPMPALKVGSACQDGLMSSGVVVP